MKGHQHLGIHDALYLFPFVCPFQDVSGIGWHLQFSHGIHKFDFPIRIQEGELEYFRNSFC